VSLVTAGVSATTSIGVALIERGKDKSAESGSSPAFPAPAVRKVHDGLTLKLTQALDFGVRRRISHGPDPTWLAVALIMAVEGIVLGLNDAEFSAGINSVILIPAATVALALARPVGWGYATLTVTLLHAFLVGSAIALGRGAFVASDPVVFFLSFVANALVVAGIAFLRTGAKPVSLGGALVTSGAGVLVWLYAPMIAGGGEPRAFDGGRLRMEPAPAELHAQDPDGPDAGRRPPVPETYQPSWGRRVRLQMGEPRPPRDFEMPPPHDFRPRMPRE
jgi:hypothetical protein